VVSGELGKGSVGYRREEVSKRRKGGRRRWKAVSMIELEPLGYPLRAAGEEGETVLTTDNPEIFQAYAREQWGGLYVKKGDLLFDRSLFPDFAFKIVEMAPSEGQITNRTVFKLSRRRRPEVHGLAKISFSDVVGQERAKRKCMIIKRYLEEPEFFKEWAPKAVLFYGPPGTGKTMMAQALANEAKASFFFVKSPELIGTHVGDAANRIHRLFKRARDGSPSIVYIDEIDAVGLDRRFQSVRGDVTEVVNALLAEMDALEGERGVVCIGATNNIMLLDASLRSRFEEEIEFTLPNLEERKRILEMYAAKIPLRVEADFNKIARITEGFSGRDLKEKVLKAVFHQAIAEGVDVITHQMIEESVRGLIRKDKGTERLFI